MRTHPNAREIYRLALIFGLLDANGECDRSRVHSWVAFLYPALTDRNHSLFNQINHAPESGWPTRWPGPRFTAEELAEIKMQSKIFRATGIIHPRGTLRSNSP
jgi:hypothetical protein